MENTNAETGEDKKQKYFKTLKSFLKKDMQIKENLLKIAPSNEDNYNEESRIDYTDKLYSSLRDFKDSMQIVSEGFEFGEEVTNALNDFAEKIEGSLAIGRYESGVGEKAYNKGFSNMRPEFVEEVKNRCVGYTRLIPGKLANLINKATTVNEVLHVMHSYIMNNEEIIGSMPQLSQKENKIGEPITLYGEQTDISREIFENFPLELDVGITDIISMQDKVFMMIRDRGHALTIDMNTSNEEEISLSYFVPKLCNEGMVRALKGVDQSTINKMGAKGSFVVRREELTQELFGFIDKVPTDADKPKTNRDEIIAEIRANYPLENANTGNEGVEIDEGDSREEEPLIEPQIEHQVVNPFFSAIDADKMACQKGRTASRIRAAITKLFNPLRKGFFGKNNKDINTDTKDIR